MLLALVMVLSGSAAAFATGETGGAGTDGTDSSSVTPIDPSTLNVKTVGDKIDIGPISQPGSRTAEYGPDDIVRVSIVLNDKSTIDAGYSVKNYSENKAAKAYRETLKARQDAVAAEISRKLGKTLDVQWNLTLAVNIISANVRYRDISAIKLVSGVKDVFVEKQLKIAEVEAGTDTANTSEYMVGAAQAWSTGYTGAGQLVAIIDTGIDYTHQAFDEGAFLYAINELGGEVDLLTEDEIPSGDLNGSGVYVSAKIPYAYNYKDKTSTLDQLGHMNDLQTNHGSHVAGIAAANRYVPGATEGTYIDAAENTYAVGMAPDAQLVVMKVFGAAGGPYESDYMPAIEDALILGCASVNLSLGSDAEGWTFSQIYQDFLNFLSSNSSIGTVLSISAGNSGAFTMYQPYGYLYADDVRTNTIGSPASYINSLAVASANNTGRTGVYIEFDTSVKAFYNDTADEDTTYAPMTSIPGTYSYVYIDTIGEAEDLAEVNAVEPLAGKIIIVNRGEINFSVKGNNAWAYGPKAILVANNQSGTLNMNLSAFEGTCPMVLIPLESARSIKAGAEAHDANGITYYTGTAEVVNEIYSGPMTDYYESSAEMSMFSGWGVPGSLTLKPEITAPGGYIYSVNGSSASTQNANTGPTSYVNYSGTSMAAPHIAGLTAVLSQYLDENDIAEKNADLAANYSRRAIMQSLLMSTAEPLYNSSDNFSYYPVLQQGAGLANVSNAINAGSVIMMGQEDLTLTAVTGAAADGKVKAELGDDLFIADEAGSRQFSFTVYNLLDVAQEYMLGTDLFVQGWYGTDNQGNMIAGEETVNVGWDVEYDFEHAAVANDHDVNKDGKTDDKDAQAITDYITGILGDSDINKAVADMDADGEITSYDAYLLLNYSEENAPKLVVPAGGSKVVTVTITPDADDVEYLYYIFPNGFYLQGYTFVGSVYGTSDGGYWVDMHSIPILGFIGNWTDPSMFDANSVIEAVYGYYKAIGQADGSIYWNYSGNLSNYLTLTYDGVPEIFYGNRYIVEDDIPYEKFAVNSRSVIKSIDYNVLRSGGTAGYAVTKLGGDYPEVLDASLDQAYLYGLWYNENTGNWEETETQEYEVETTPAKLGLEEGDRFRIGYYSMPEYYGIVYNMLVNMSTGNTDPINGTYDGLVDTKSAFAALLENEFLGNGSYVGYDFTVDDTAPVIDKDSAAYDPSTGIITFSASDNFNLAYAAVLSLDGETAYWELAPGGDTVSAEADITNLAADIEGYVALFVADYAGNEAAVALKINDNSSVDPTLVASVTVDPEELDIYKGNKVQLIPNVSPLTADQTVIWTSSDEDVVTVDESGEVTAVGAGTATVTVKSASDPTKYAECPVNVFSVEKKLNALLMDEDSQTFFVSFGADDLPNWGRNHEAALEVNILNALNTSSALYASTVSSQSSYVYTVDGETFEPTLVGENYAPAFDMAPFSWLGSDDMFIIYPYAYFLVFGDYEPYAPEEDGSEYVGYPYMVSNLSEFLGEDVWIAGLAAKEFSFEIGSSTVDFYGDYYLIDDQGVLWTITVDMTVNIDENYNITGLSNIVFSDPEKVMETGIKGASFLYQNLFYDGEYLYWSYYKGDTAHFAVILPDEAKIYDGGDFGKNIWPATGFYMDGVTGADLEVEASSAPAVPTLPMSAEPSAEAAAMLADEELRALVNARIDQAEKQMKAADQAVGGLDMVKPELSSKKTTAREEILSSVKPAEASPRRADLPAAVKATDGISFFYPNSYFDIEITEEEDITNGKYVVNYDPEKLVFNDYYSSAYGDAASINDDGNGTVTIAVADLYGFAAGQTIAYVSFDTAEAIDLSVTVNTVERSDDLELEEECMISSPSYIMSTSASLPGALHFNTYAVPNAQLLADEDSFFVFSYTNAKSRTNPQLVEDIIVVSEAEDNVSGSITRKLLKNTFFIAQLHDEVKVSLYSGNGEQQPLLRKTGDDYVSVGGEFVTTAWEYLDGRIANSTNPKMVAIAKAVQNYGTSAQIYFNYNTGTMTDEARAALTEAVSNDSIVEEMAAYAAKESGNIPAGVSKITSTLTVEADHTFKYYFYLNSGADVSDFTFKIDDAVVTPTYDEGNGGRYCIQIPGIPSGQLSKTHTFSVSDGTDTRVIEASALSYAYGRVLNSSNEDMKVLAKALYLYSMAADAYFGGN